MQVSEANSQLWVKINKDEAVLLAGNREILTVAATGFIPLLPSPPLTGHEYPYGIQMYHNRHKLEYSDNKPSQLQFIVKRKESMSINGT